MAYTVLIADDEKEIRSVLRLYLENTGYRVLEAADGIEAERIFAGEKVDLCLLDIMMPGKDGREVCKFIRSKYDVPVVFLTALGEENDIIQGYEIGADEYITKPFSTKHLLVKINALINRYKGLLIKDGKMTVDEIDL